MVSQDTLIALGQIGVRGYLLWHGIDRACLCHALASVLDANLCVASPAAVQVLVPPEYWPVPWRNEARFSQAERAVLRGLAAGLTEKQIAQDEAMSLRTVERVISSLEGRLEAPSLYVLALKVRDIGLG